MNNVDIVFCSLPPLSVDRVPGAPAILKAVAEDAGYSAIGLDLNIDFFVNQCSKNIDKFIKLNFESNRFYEESDNPLISEWLNESIKKLKKYYPKVIGVSVFSFLQQYAAEKLCKHIRQYLPDTKIIIGGYGINRSSTNVDNSGYSKIELIKPFYQLMTDHNLIDKAFLGNDLSAMIDYFSTVIGPAKKKVYNEDKVIFNTPIPNYDDYQLDNYIFTYQKSLPVTGSRGCVRQCTFCDVPGQFGRFSFRTGTDIAQEMIYLSEKYNIRFFEFTDSLVNGSLKAFREWLTVLADYNDSVSQENKIEWFGQYITRPQNQIPKDLYSLMRRSGVTNLVVGVESGSDAVLAAMKKQMTTKDVFDELEQFEKHNISMHLLMFSGFYNETVEHFNETLDFIVKLQKYIANGVIYKISPGTPFFINEAMFVGQHAESLGIELDPTNQFNWKNKNDPSNNLLERINRRLIMQEVLDSLGIPISANSIENLHKLTYLLDKIQHEQV